MLVYYGGPGAGTLGSTRVLWVVPDHPHLVWAIYSRKSLIGVFLSVPHDRLKLCHKLCAVSELILLAELCHHHFRVATE